MGKKISLTTQILIGSLVGLALGMIFKEKIAPIGVIGQIFLNLIMMSVPLVILGAVTEAVGALSPSELGKLGFKIFIYFIISTIISASIGVFFAYVIKPGVGLSLIPESTNITGHNMTVQEIITGFFPKNIVASLGAGNMMQVIIFALFLGIATSQYVHKTGDDSLLKIIKTLNKTLLIIIANVMKIAPFGVMALLAKVAGTTGFSVLISLGKYLFTILISTLIIMLIYVLATAIKVGVNPIALTKKIIPMSLMAATTTSSAMSLPIKMKDSYEKLGVSDRINGLVNPLGMVLNSAGQAVFLSIASIFITQIFNLDMSPQRLVQVIVLSTLACMGTLAVPGGALVIFASLMPTLALPVEGVAFIAGVDWFRGAITTVPNVAGDALVSLIIAKEEKEFDKDVFDGKVVRSYEDKAVVTSSK